MLARGKQWVDAYFHQNSILIAGKQVFGMHLDKQKTLMEKHVIFSLEMWGIEETCQIHANVNVHLKMALDNK